MTNGKTVCCDHYDLCFSIKQFEYALDNLKFKLNTFDYLNFFLLTTQKKMIVHSLFHSKSFLFLELLKYLLSSALHRKQLGIIVHSVYFINVCNLSTQS